MGNQMTVVREVEKGLAAMQGKISSVLPSQIPAKQFLRTATMAIEREPTLLNAERQSLYKACMNAAADGLLLDGRQAALVVFGGKAQYMPMINGLLQKVRNSGQVATVSASVVKENDHFEYFIDEDGPHIKHVPELRHERGVSYLAYAIAKLKDGSIQIEVMTRDEIEQVRMSSRSGNKNGQPAGIWRQWPDEMWKKTVLRRLCKYLPSSTELERVFESDDEDYKPPQSEQEISEPHILNEEPLQSEAVDAILNEADGDTI